MHPKDRKRGIQRWKIGGFSAGLWLVCIIENLNYLLSLKRAIATKILKIKDFQK